MGIIYGAPRVDPQMPRNSQPSIGSSGIALVSCDSARQQPSQRSAGTLRVVLIATIEQRLQSRSAAQVLAELSSSDDHIESVSTATVRCGLISYRQEVKSDGEYAGLTLDGQAFLGVLAAGKRIGLEALWLDAWCQPRLERGVCRLLVGRARVRVTRGAGATASAARTTTTTSSRRCTAP